MKKINFITRHRNVSIDEVFKFVEINGHTRNLLNQFNDYYFETIIPVLETSTIHEYDLIICNEAGMRFADRYVEKMIDGEVCFQHNVYPVEKINSCTSIEFGNLYEQTEIEEIEHEDESLDLYKTYKSNYASAEIAKIIEYGDNYSKVTIYSKYPNGLYVVCRPLMDNDRVVQYVKNVVDPCDLFEKLCDDKSDTSKDIEAR